ncbi:MAG: hypothetical protein PHI97_21915 [Desulfobulbus sp.]|nr:hypothetical protein [Desulfobulbus sp.]
MTWLATISSPWRADRPPATAGAGRNSMDAAKDDLVCGAADLRDEPQQSYSLTYSEIGLRLCQCVESGLITAEQAKEIGNQLFPIRG